MKTVLLLSLLFYCFAGHSQKLAGIYISYGAFNPQPDSLDYFLQFEKNSCTLYSFHSLYKFSPDSIHTYYDRIKTGDSRLTLVEKTTGTWELFKDKSTASDIYDDRFGIISSPDGTKQFFWLPTNGGDPEKFIYLINDIQNPDETASKIFFKVGLTP